MTQGAAHPVGFEALFAATPGPYLILSPAFTIVAVNEAYLRATMTVREEIVGRGLFEVFPDNPDDPAADGVSNLRRSLERVLALKRPDAMATQKYDIRRPEEEGGGFEERFWNPLNVPVLDDAGDVELIIHHVEDATDLVRLMEADRQNREQAERRELLIAQLRRANEMLARQADVNSILVRDNLSATEALHLEEQRFRAIADLLPGIVYRGISRPDGTYIEPYVSAGLEASLGMKPETITAGGKALFNFIHPEERDEKLALFRDAGAALQTVVTEMRMLRPDGTIRWWRLHTTPHRHAEGGLEWNGIALDITDLKDTEHRLQHVVKMEAIGQLTGGVAHDFNNLLTVIMGSSETLAEELSGKGELHTLADLILRASQRGSELTSQLLAFARRQALEPRAIDVDRLITGMEGLLKRALDATVEVDFIQHDGLWRALADPAQLESAILNLAVNARDAMPGGGRLTIETCNTDIDASYAAMHDEVTPGRYVLVSVSDTGTGMDAATAARAFDPFFTTKETGKGTGLGLSMVFGFVKQSGGHIKIYSEPGFGTTMKLYLPQAPSDAAAADAGPESLDVPLGRETILAVEDTDMLRGHVERTLRSLGYTVIAASGGAEALPILRSGTRIDLLFTDIVMAGGMNGRELAEAALQLRPDLKVLYTSGYTQNAIVHHGRLDPGIELLRKPYGRRELAVRIRAVLDKPAGG